MLIAADVLMSARVRGFCFVCMWLIPLKAQAGESENLVVSRDLRC
jgi:hypothetical protein